MKNSEFFLGQKIIRNLSPQKWGDFFYPPQIAPQDGERIAMS